jgi:membrane-associated phospholipid phosphatase
MHDDHVSPPAPPARWELSRRDLLRGGAALASGLPLAAGLPLAVRPSRPAEAYRVRLEAAAFQRDREWAVQAANGDEAELPDYLACYSKALPHDRLGVVNPRAYELLLRALHSGQGRDFELVPTGKVKLANPQAALAFNLIGPDPAAIACPPAPRFASAEQAAEMVELYWQALTRDLPFAEYGSQQLAARAAAELDALGRRAAPGRGPKVTPATLFRGAAAGSLAGPYISQFLCHEISYAPLPVTQKIRTLPPGRDFLDRYDAWLDVQNGVPAGPATTLAAADAVPCYVRCGRDLAEYVHSDFSFQAALGAGLILLRMGAPANPANPYLHSRSQSGFATFGPPQLLAVLAMVTQAALTACWYQKWMVHRRLRPEELAGRVENLLRRRASYALDRGLLDSAALAEVLRRRGGALLSCVYPEGSPTHPSYPAGHAVAAGAGTTVLKAFFDETFVLPDPVEASADGRALRAWEGPPLTVGAELDKLAANIGMGRVFAGIHWRSDVEAGHRLGEEVALSLLRELRLTGNELFSGFRLHRLDGQPVTA